MHASLTNLVQNQMQKIAKQHEQPPQYLEKSENSTLPRSHLLVEQKLAMLEKIVGTQTGASSSSSIVQRLAEAERLVSCIDKEGIDALASKAKLIRYADLFFLHNDFVNKSFLCVWIVKLLRIPVSIFLEG